MKMVLNPPAPVLRRVLAALACALAFLMMASVFSPDRTRAGVFSDPLPGVPPKSIDYPSVNAHEGLQSLGVIEDRGYAVQIFATPVGPRYTIVEKSTGREVGTLLSVEKAHQAFPELQLPSMEFNAGIGLMMADTPSTDWTP